VIIGDHVTGEDLVDGKREAVAIPGHTGGPHTPWIMYSCLAAQNRGAVINHVWWPTDSDPLEMPASRRAQWVVQQVRPILHGLQRPLLVGKSLGTHAAILAAEKDLPAVWITPLIAPGAADDRLVEALRNSSAPCLLIGGTADPTWDGALARKLTTHVFEAEGADHGLYVPGPLAASAAILSRMVTAVEHFLDETVWPI